MTKQELLNILMHQNIEEHTDDTFLENIEAIIQMAESDGADNKLWLAMLAFEYGRITGIQQERATKEI